MPYTLLLLALLLPEVWVYAAARGRCYRRIDTVPPCDDALVLGTAKYTRTGSHNVYYQYRIAAALDLWRQGKVCRFIVSGNGLTDEISETVAMQADLVAAGVPESVIWQDEAGMRTLDSVYRYAATFSHARRLCVVSQPFHNRRALALARRCGIDAVAYDAQAVGWRGGWRIQVRERAARLRLLWDMLRGTAPQHSTAALPLRQCPTRPSKAA
ncbi:SanA protein [Neisseria sp. HSC-16F19]|nr:ElyC/SanA/YdcF family protein [Neisseria sp. HSC-16F19]MCP2040675.1 SanA protein [Neisseria sp. HSC-16F19]